MRKIFSLLSLIFLLLLKVHSQNAPNGQLVPAAATSIKTIPIAYNSGITPSFTRIWNVKMPTSNFLQIVESGDIKNVIQTTTFSDGMGRELQNVERKITPLGKDMVTPRIYDNSGREVYSYLAYPSSSSDGKIKSSPFSEQATYFQAQPQYSGEQIFYSQTIYDNSPIGNIEKVLGVGNSWGGNDRGSSEKFEANGLDEVRYWSVGSMINSTPASQTFYDEASLYRGTSIDPHGKRVVVYKDKEGKLVLKKVENKNNGSASINDYLGWLCTYYVYDDVGHLRYTITPRAVEWLINNSWAPITVNILDELCFRYEYDDNGRVIISKSPGAEEACSVYDKRDRVVLFRDGNLSASGKWHYTKFDDLNRPVEKGLWTNSQSRNYHQTLAENSESYPSLTSGFEIFEQSFFDDYSWANTCGCGISPVFNASQLNGGWLNTTAAGQFPYPEPLIQTQQVSNLGTISKTKVLNSNPAKYIYSVVFYDKEGNVIQSVKTNITGGQDITTTQYGYGGKILATHFQHKYIVNGISQTQDVYARFEYDDAGRLLKTYKKINNDIEKIQANNLYNEQSQLVKVELGKSSTTNVPIETIDFSYTLSGAIKGMNEAFVNGTTDNRFFGEVLYRDFGFSNPQFNGNVSGIEWRGLSDGERRAFGYAYDPANRVLKSDFTQYNSGWNNSAGIDYSLKLGDGANPESAYDANGNIISVSQSALKLYESEVVDNLVYNYENSNYSNRLSAVSEIATGGTNANSNENVIGDFKDNLPGAPAYDYLYDQNGNLIIDNNKGISSITYNYLDKPVHIQINGKGSIDYVYDATGEKLQKIITPLTGSSITYNYVGGFTYKDDALQYLFTEDGRIRPTISTSGAPGWAYDYFEKDHLGNIRTILTDEVRTETYPLVTFETSNQPTYSDYYEGTDIGLTPKPGDFGTSTTNQAQVQLLQKNAQSIGVSKLMKVMAKDKVSVSVDYYFPAQTVNNSSAYGAGSVLSLLSSFFNSPSSPSIFSGKGAEISQALDGSNPFKLLLSPQNAASPGILPKAYLNILFFDEQFNFVNQNSEIVPVTVAGSRQNIAEIEIEVPKSGYVFAYVSNESNNLVYFDNFQLLHHRGPLLEENHYNTFGAKMMALCSRALPGVSNNLGYQSKGLDDEFDLDWYDFGARSYDPQLGRFLQQDPADQFASPYTGMGNHWVRGTDPDGKIVWLIGAAIGAVVNVVTNIDNIIQSPGKIFGYAGVGAVSGALASVGQFAAAGAVSGLGNAILGGQRNIGELAKSTVIGAASSVVGGAIGGKLNSVVSTQLSRVVGSQATKIVSNIASSAIVGGGFGAGFSLFSGGDPWQGFVSGMRTGAISGAISSLVPAAINKWGKPKAPEPLPQRNREQQEIIKTEQLLLKAPEEMKLLPAPKYAFSRRNSIIHWLKHTQGLLYENGEFIKHPGNAGKPGLPRELSLKLYREGSKTFFGVVDNGTASFTNHAQGKIYMYNSNTRMYGVGNTLTGKIITYLKVSDRYWNNVIKNNNR